MTNLTMEFFVKKLESNQYNAAIAVTRAVRGRSQTKIYKEMGLETLKFTK